MTDNADIGPTLFVVAGPNGSGKSTITASGAIGNLPVIDPDVIARRLNPEDVRQAAFTAGKEALAQQDAYLESRDSFAVETTLAGNRPLALMQAAHDRGFEVSLNYVRLETVDLTIERIDLRVALGGHDIPDADVERRFGRSMENLPTAIAIADRTSLWDNTMMGQAPERVAYLTKDAYHFSENAPDWAIASAHAAAVIQAEEAQTQPEIDNAVIRQAECAVQKGVMTSIEMERLISDLARDRDAGIEDDHCL